MAKEIARDERMRSVPDGDFSVLSWNVLADVYLEAGRGDYAHVKAEAVDWVKHRWPLMLKEVAAAAPDAVCFQEVRSGIFDRDMLPAMAELGYAGRMVAGAHKEKWDRGAKNKNNPDRRVGCATFWATESYEPTAEIHRSRTMGVVLKSRVTKRSVALVNVHLEGKPSASVNRLRQLQRTLCEVAMAAEHHGVVVAGDFNCLLGSSACSSYLAFGAVEPGVPDWGHPCADEVKQVPPHGYIIPEAGGFKSAYSPSAAAGLTGVWSFGEAFTYCQSPGGPVDGLDQIWATAHLELVASRRLYHSDEHRIAILAGGLPSMAEPSDHIPVGAVYRWARGAAEAAPPDLRKVMASAAAAKAAAAAGDGGTAAGLPTSRADLEAEIETLLIACPFASDAARLEYSELLSDLPGLPPKGKPTPDQLAELKRRRTRKVELAATLPDEAQQNLRRVRQLVRALKKAADGPAAAAPAAAAAAPPADSV